jgi:hypothetical protein
VTTFVRVVGIEHHDLRVVSADARRVLGQSRDA